MDTCRYKYFSAKCEEIMYKFAYYIIVPAQAGN